MITAAKHKSNYQQVAKQFNVEPELVQQINEFVYRFIRSKIKELPLREITTDEELQQHKYSFTLPKLGTLYTSIHLVNFVNTHVRTKSKEDNPDVYGSLDNNG